MAFIFEPIRKIFDFFFPRPAIPGPRRGDPIEPQELSSEYGRGVSRSWGRSRVPAVVLWAGTRKDTYDNNRWHYFQSFAVSFGTPVGWIEKIWFDSEEWDLGALGSNRTAPDPPVPIARSHVYHKGGSPPHPLQSYKREGSIVRQQGNVIEFLMRIVFGPEIPVYTNYCYVAFDNMYLNKFGGRLPKITAQVARVANRNATSIVRGVAIECGLNLDQISTPGTSLLRPRPPSTEVTEGYRRDEDTEGKEIIYRISRIEGWDPIERYTGIEMIKKSATDPITEIDDTDLLVFDNVNVYQEERLEESEIPEVIELTYADPSRDLQSGTARAQHVRDATTGYTSGTREKESASWPVTLSAQNAKQTVNRWLETARAERASASFRLPPKYLFLEPGDVVSLTLNAIGQILRLRLQIVEIGADNSVHICLLYTSPSPRD